MKSNNDKTNINSIDILEDKAKVRDYENNVLLKGLHKGRKDRLEQLLKELDQCATWEDWILMDDKR